MANDNTKEHDIDHESKNAVARGQININEITSPEGINVTKLSTTLTTENRRCIQSWRLFIQMLDLYLAIQLHGYAVVGGGNKGGYVIQSFKHVFCNEKEIYKQNLDSIVNQICLKTRNLVGYSTVMQNVEDVSKINYDVTFQVRS